MDNNSTKNNNKNRLWAKRLNERRRPEETALYQLDQERAESFSAFMQAETGANLPQFVKDEFDAFLDCGILAHGFLRLPWECSLEKLVAFSCKRRGFCPSCGARGMAQSAAHLVDNVICVFYRHHFNLLSEFFSIV